MDRDKLIKKVIKAVEQHNATSNCIGCPYIDEPLCEQRLLADAVALLKEQEAKPVKRINGKRNHFLKCGGCNANLTSGMKFCPQCGCGVKWE